MLFFLHRTVDATYISYNSFGEISMKNKSILKSILLPILSTIFVGLLSQNWITETNSDLISLPSILSTVTMGGFIVYNIKKIQK